MQRVFLTYRQHAIWLQVSGDLSRYQKCKLIISLSLVSFTLNTGLVQTLWLNDSVLSSCGVSNHVDPLTLKQQA